MAFTWILALVTLMTGSPEDRKDKRVRIGKDESDLSQERTETPDAQDSEMLTNSNVLMTEDENVKVVEGDAVMDEQAVFSEYLICSQSGHLVHLKFEEMTAPSQPSIIHEGESSRQSPTLSSVHRVQQQLITDLDELEAKVDQLTTTASECRKEIQSISDMVKTIIDRLGFHGSDTSDTD